MNKKIRNWGLIAGGIVLIVVFIVFILGPLVEKINRIQKGIKVAELEVKEGLRVQIQKKEIMEEYKKYEPYLKNAGISVRERTGNFLKELERTSQEANLSVNSLTPSEITEDSQKIVYGADFKSEGDMEEILFFFSKIQDDAILQPF